ncbi:DUF418 domain-containing protein [Streptomyces nigra]|uniref:DUF418 domain-containing protein n=1 Tax=Streptomyces nigra TaxID=1827580 RepID=UPI003451641F
MPDAAAPATATPGHNTASDHQRVEAVDMLRGAALLGILLVNARMIAGTPHPSRTGTADWAAAVVVAFFAEIKFYPLLAFLFGVSMVLAMGEQGTALRRTRESRYLRRLSALFLLGAAHLVFLFGGDILTTYALVGAAAYLLRNAAARTLLLVGAGTMLAFFTCFLALAVWFALSTKHVQEAPYPTPELIAAYQAGPAETLAAHLSLLPSYVFGSAFFSPHVFACVLLGMAAGKTGLLEREWQSARLRRTALVSAAVGVPGSVVYAMVSYTPSLVAWSMPGRAVAVITGPALTVTYACMALMLLRSGRSARLVGLLAKAGRNTLSHYLGQSIVLCLVFTGYGLGLYGKIGGPVLVAGCVGLFAVQLLLTDRYHGGKGPAEAFVRAIQGR